MYCRGGSRQPQRRKVIRHGTGTTGRGLSSLDSDLSFFAVGGERGRTAYHRKNGTRAPLSFSNPVCSGLCGHKPMPSPLGCQLLVDDGCQSSADTHPGASPNNTASCQEAELSSPSPFCVTITPQAAACASIAMRLRECATMRSGAASTATSLARAPKGRHERTIQQHRPLRRHSPDHPLTFELRR